MTKNDDKCVPALRFKGFNNDWAQHKLGDIAQRKNKTSDCSKLPNVSYEDISPNIGTLNKSVNKLSTGKKGILFKKDDVLFGKLRPYLNNYLFADFTGIAIGDFWVLNHKEAPQFLFYLIQSPKFRYISNISSGSKMPRSDWNLVSNYKFNVPAVFEQTNIGKTLKLIDTLITLQQRKLQQLKLLKKAMLQDLFTDKKVPKLRFSGFKENWIQCKLGEIVKVIGGGTPSTKNPKYWNGQINWYSPNEIGSSIFVNSSKKKITSEGLKHSSAKLLPGNKTILFTSRAGIGDMAIMTSDGTTNQGFQSWIVDSKDTDIYFLYTLGFKLKRQSLRKASGSTFLEISNSEVKQLKLTVPSIEEQELIGLIVQKMDRLIVIQQKEFNKLESLKKFLLQNMFI